MRTSLLLGTMAMGLLLACPRQGKMLAPQVGSDDAKNGESGSSEASARPSPLVAPDAEGRDWLIGDMATAPIPGLEAWAPREGDREHLVARITGPGGLEILWLEGPGRAEQIAEMAQGMDDAFVDCGPYLEADRWTDGPCCTVSWRDSLGRHDGYALNRGDRLLRLEARLPSVEALQGWTRFLRGLRAQVPSSP